MVSNVVGLAVSIPANVQSLRLQVLVINGWDIIFL
jgi:hypothetical protein